MFPINPFVIFKSWRSYSWSFIIYAALMVLPFFARRFWLRIKIKRAQVNSDHAAAHDQTAHIEQVQKSEREWIKTGQDSDPEGNS